MNNCTSYWRVLTPTALFSSSVFLYTLSLSLLFPVNAFSSIQNGVAAGSFESIYFLLNPKFQTGTLQIMSLSDGNTITVGNTTLNLNENQTGSIPAGADLESGAIIQGTRQFSLSSEVDTTDLPVPGHFIGTQFAIPHFRGDHTYYILSPYDDAQLTITQAGIPTLVTALKGQVLEFDAGPTNDISGLIQSDQPVLISHIANMGTLDAYPVPPTSKKLWGIHSNNTSVGAFEDDTTITVYGSTGATESFTLNAGGYRMLTLPDGLEGSGSAIHIAADKPIAAIQSADSDGGDATAFLNTAYLATDYGIPVNTQYIAVVCPKEGTTVSLYTNSSSPANQTCDGNGTNPGKAYFGSTTDGTNIAAGARLKSNHPVYIYSAIAHKAVERDQGISIRQLERTRYP